MTGGATAGATDIRLIAFYLTQFHPIPENDRWWGKGFTEWTNVTKAVPLFRGHYQPHLPADMGFYDLRVRETRREQIALAKAGGIDGFCYYYYWFSGKRLLERPLDDMLADPASDMPFCLCWANENWTRRWDAAEHEILIAQQYLPEDDLEFIKSVEPFLRDPRYIHVDGAPLLVVYRPQHLPDAARSARVWRDYCASVGLPRLHLACALTHGNWDHTQFGFDSGVEFPPHNMRAPDLAPELAFHEPFEGYCPDYTEIGDMYLANRYGPDRSVFRGVVTAWDNTARRGRIGTVLLNGTPENYEYWLAEAIRHTRSEFPGQERLVFINAWNEWAEGCHLEPDRRSGHALLEATVAARGGGRFAEWSHRGVPPDSALPKSEGGANGYVRVVPKRKSAASRAFRTFRDAVSGRTLRRMLRERNGGAKKP
jgi:lipopolysaccharide biosynthesis protein